MQSDTQMIQHTTVTDPVYSDSLSAEQYKQNPVEGKIPKYLSVQYFLITNKRQYKIRSKNYSEHRSVKLSLFSTKEEEREKQKEKKKKQRRRNSFVKKGKKRKRKKKEGCFQSVELDHLHLDRLRR